jgi:hypothetical protein
LVAVSANRCGLDRHGVATRGEVRLGEAWRGKDSLSWWRFPRIVKARLGMAERGGARQGLAGLGFHLHERQNR